MPKIFEGKLSYPKLYYAKLLLCGSVFIYRGLLQRNGWITHQVDCILQVDR